MGSYSLGGYASWEHESGFYLDGVVKLNRFKSNVAGKMSSVEPQWQLPQQRAGRSH